MLKYEILNILFHFLHLAVIFVNLTFWLSFRTLRIAQITQILTLINWFGFGLYYGFGYCFLTDWHWQIKEKLGEKDVPSSYIKYVLDEVTGSNWDADKINYWTMAALFISVIGCLVQTIRFKRKQSLPY